MKLIPVHYKGEIVGHIKVSDEDYPYLSQSSWTPCSGRRYVSGWVRLPGDSRSTKQLVHRVVMGTAGSRDGSHTDHINGDRWDNRRENLRTVTAQANLGKRRLHAGQSSTSKYRGVKQVGAHWFGTATIEGTKHQLGPFVTELEAAKNIALFRTRNSLIHNPEDVDFVRAWAETEPIRSPPSRFVGIRFRAGLYLPFSPDPLGKYATREEAEFALSSNTNLYEERRKIWKDAAQDARKRYPTRKKRKKRTPEQADRARAYNRSLYITLRELRDAERARHPSRIEGVVWREGEWLVPRVGRFATQDEAEAAKLAKDQERREKEEARRVALEEREKRKLTKMLESTPQERARREAQAAYRKLEKEEKLANAAEKDRLRKERLAKAQQKRIDRDARLHQLRTAKTKRCRVCRKDYPRNELYFYPREDAVDGFRAQCRTCYLAVQG